VTRGNKVWAELLQLVPIVSLAFPFILHGSVDLARAGTGFLVAALLSLPVAFLVVRAGQLLNPILVGAALWLWLGAAAFNLPISGLAAWLTATQAFGLFVAAFAVGVGATVFSRFGFLACGGVEGPWARRASVVLLIVSALCCAWSWFFRHDIRLGGGAPFIVLNVVRRALCLRASRTT
jgi:hypothetical protein